MHDPEKPGAGALSNYLPTERLADIEARLARDGKVVAAELARIYETSEDTIRRDLRALAAEGRCRRRLRSERSARGRGSRRRPRRRSGRRWRGWSSPG
jgi:predicted ArsR family transcriptional regulator